MSTIEPPRSPPSSAEAQGAPPDAAEITARNAWVSRAPRRAKRSVPELIGGRYRVESLLGHGGMASVLRVRDEVSDHLLALKLLHREVRPKHAALFEREYHTLAGLSHPHVVEVFEYGNDESGPYYTMELLSGKDLSRTEPLPWREVCAIMRDVASALSVLHTKRLVHRDVSARNVFRTREGHVKLIDFGTLSPFGTPRDVAGTPPFVAPEALYGQALDQRSDLYALGALGYFLLTGCHAYPVRNFGELSEAWKTPPPLPSERARERVELDAIPKELDALIESLLSHDPMARPASTAEVIGRLGAIASLPSTTGYAEVAGYLSSKSFVGRERERAILKEALCELERGRGRSFAVESASGMGRSRLLTELAREARLTNAAVVHVDALVQSGPLGIPEAILLMLLDCAHATAMRAFASLRAVLGHVSRRVRERLELDDHALSELPTTAGEARVRLQAALLEACEAFAAQRPLVVVVDHAEALEESSAAFVAALAYAAKRARVFLVCAYENARRKLPAPLETLRQSSTVLELAPLTREEHAQLLRSVFGDAQHLGRLAELLYERSGGVPGRTMELAEHLVREEVILHADGVWHVPDAIASELLPKSHGEIEAARIVRLSARARELAENLSVHPGHLSLDLIAALSECLAAELFEALEALVAEGILVGSADGYRFRDDATRSALADKLEPTRKARAHRAAGEHLLHHGGSSALTLLSAGVHLLSGGDEARGMLAAAQAAKQLVTSEHGSMSLAAPLLERAFTLSATHRASPHERIALLSALTLAGYYDDRRYATRYAPETLKTLTDVLGLTRARALRPWLGRHLALLVSLLVAALGFVMRAFNPRVPSFRESLLFLFSCVAATTGISVVCVDPKAARRYAELLEPFSVLPRNHPARLMHEFCANLACTAEDRLSLARTRWQNLIARLGKNAPIRGLPDDARTFYYAGALYACGVLESWRDDSEALAYADTLESLGLKLYELSADQVRMLHYANQGDAARFEHYRERVERHAIQRGSAWQVDTWASAALITVALRTYDALRMRQALEQLKRLSREVPSLTLLVRRAQGAYLLLREKPEASAVLASVLDETPLAVVGWARAHGTLARALNTLRHHERAREVCLRALAHLTPDDLRFSAMNQGLRIELALAEAGLGHHELARTQLEGMLAEHSERAGPLTLGAVQEALARVALLAADDMAFRGHASEMARLYRSTNIPSLVERAARFLREGRRSASFPVHQESHSARAHRDELALLERIHKGSDLDAESALAQVAAFAELSEAYLFVAHEERAQCVAAVGAKLAPEALTAWVTERIQAGRGASNITKSPTRTKSARSDTPTLRTPDGLTYRAALLANSEPSDDDIVGALVFPDDAPTPLSSRVLSAMAKRLREQTAPKALGSSAS